MDKLARKYARLKEIIGSYGSLLVAYSGGVDSTLLLKAASDALGEKVLAVKAASAVHPVSELSFARKAARRIGARLLVVESDELADGRFIRNRPDRCYRCKLRLLQRLVALARREKMARVAVASHLDDLKDYRPGERAVREMGVVSPLRLAGFTKEDVRRLSRRLGLPGWDREAMACLASRIPYGEPIAGEKLERIARAERFLKRRGFKSVRVRCPGGNARIEVDAAEIGRFGDARLRGEVVRKLKSIGFPSVSLDLEGYRTGSLNYGLKLKVEG